MTPVNRSGFTGLPATPGDGAGPSRSQASSPVQPSSRAGGLNELSGLLARVRPNAENASTSGAALAPRRSILPARGLVAAAGATAPVAPRQAIAAAAVPMRQSVTAAKISQALQALVDQPLRSIAPIGDEVGMGRASINNHIAPGGQCRKLDKLVSLADYDVHAQAIQDALCSLGHDAQAAELASLAQVGKRTRRAQASDAPRVATPSHHFDAYKLVKALQYFQDRKVARAAGRLDDSTLLRSVDETVGVKVSRVAAWVTTEGRLVKTPASIARLPGYLECREEIQDLLVDFGQLESARSLLDFVPMRKAVSAASLAQAVKVLAEGPERTSRDVLLASGMEVAALDTYLFGSNPDRFAKTALLPDYDLHADAIRSSLQRMGRQEVAEALLPTASQRAQQHATSSLIPWSADVFLQRVGGNMHKIEAVARLIRAGAGKVEATRQARAHKALILPLLNDDGGLRDPVEVESLLGGMDKRGARHLRELMARLSRRLDPPPAIPLAGNPALGGIDGPTKRMAAENFLERAWLCLNAVVAASTLLRAGAALSPGHAARSVGASRFVVRALLDDKGALRHARIVEGCLDSVDNNASEQIDKLVDRLAERLGDTPPASNPATQMRSLRLNTGVFGKPRVLLVNERTKEPARNKIEAIYGQNAALVQAPRSFANDRHRQPLRWLSTLLKDKFPGSLEVQCYFDSKTGQIIASTNRTFLNKQIAEFVRTEGLLQMLAGRASKLVAPQSDRSERHFAKLVERLNPAADPHPTDLSDAVFAAIAEGRIEVTTRDYRENGKRVALHAERRIADHMESDHAAELDLSHLAGTMRPCGDCAAETAAGTEVRRGPFFESAAARALTNHQENLARNLRDAIGTSVTRARNGQLTFGQDTDSDSDAYFSEDGDANISRMLPPAKAARDFSVRPWNRSPQVDEKRPTEKAESSARAGLRQVPEPSGALSEAARLEQSAFPPDDFDWGRHLRNLGGGAPPAGMLAPHAHHIVFKTGRGAEMCAYLDESKAILARHQIDWLMGSENLIWAPNKNHSKAVARTVRDALMEADNTGSRELVVETLKALGKRFADNTLIGQ